MPTIEYISRNKSDFVSKKLATQFKTSDPTTGTSFIRTHEGTLVKSITGKEDGTTKTDELQVQVVCNTANFVDSHLDMLTPEAYVESLSTRGTSIPMLKDHNWSATGHIGDVTAVYLSEMEVKDLGLDSEGTTTALVMEATIKKSYDEKAFTFYKEGKINQHSIGLMYQELSLALNSSVEDDAKEKEVWDKYYPQVLNKEVVDKTGYFWVVSKVDVLENSAVLYGANSLTPTLGSTKSYTKETVKGTEVPTTPSLFIKSEFKSTNEVNSLMTDEAITTIASLKAEVATLKADVAAKAKEAQLLERSRIKSIFGAAKTFGIPNETALKFVDQDLSADLALTMCESIKTLSQIANPSPTGGDFASAPTHIKSEQDLIASNLTASLKSLTAERPDFSNLV